MKTKISKISLSLLVVLCGLLGMLNAELTSCETLTIKFVTIINITNGYEFKVKAKSPTQTTEVISAPNTILPLQVPDDAKIVLTSSQHEKVKLLELNDENNISLNVSTEIGSTGTEVSKNIKICLERDNQGIVDLLIIAGPYDNTPEGAQQEIEDLNWVKKHQ